MMSFWSRVKASWHRWNVVPDCPSCRGTGEPTPPRLDDFVYWKGQIVRVCFQCKGAGKV